MSRRAREDRLGNRPSGEIRSATFTPLGGEIIYRLRNEGPRAIHYVNELRTVRYDAADGRLVLGLSDKGRTRGTGSFEKHPEFNYVDPGSAAELRLILPPTYIRCLPDASPTGELQFEEIRPSDASEIVLEIAWSDTPFYEDPRERPDSVVATEAWALGEVAMALRVKDVKPKPKPKPKPKARAKRTGR